MSRLRKTIKRLSNVRLRYVILGSALICIFMLTMAILQLDRRMGAIDKETYCPLYGPMGHYVILRDKSGPIGAVHGSEIGAYFQRLLRDEIPQSYLVSMFTLEATTPMVLKPKLQLCNPWSDKTHAVLERNLRNQKIDFEKKMMEVLMAPGVFSGRVLEVSFFADIEDMVKKLQESNVDGPKRLYLVSRMDFEGSTSVNGWDFKKSRSEEVWGKSLPDLSGIELQVVILDGASDDLGRYKFDEFWKEYANQTGASKIVVQHVPSIS
ncbi:hypothetical protein [Oxalicibacterium faecigallinarum]|uniref:Uncharacterized protein n=1 Tax=Oxalicibacterium faecigallinarum TaxID=573741 RepID=A0A8J3AM36_9BURK|nr:hypothetical protein [Oxalicibacterium faecigallinarum]GGI16993.1 hypothetical protein GCM10008066_06740 [Oxalicibacterium faecigallinarum]